MQKHDGAIGAPWTAEDFDALEDILSELRAVRDEIPQWEFCDGFMAALVCCRRAIEPAEFLPLLLGDADDEGGDACFVDAAQEARFMALWTRRWNQTAQSLALSDVESLDDERCYHPEVMDVRGAIAALSPQERAEIGTAGPPPAFAEVWANGFMYAVENWPEEWAAPRDKEAARWLDDALQAIVALTEDDSGRPEISGIGDDGPPSISVARLHAFGAAIWAVYDLYMLGRSLGPRVAPLRKPETPGRNEACWCGSGKKFKKCHGAG